MESGSTFAPHFVQNCELPVVGAASLGVGADAAGVGAGAGADAAGVGAGVTGAAGAGAGATDVGAGATGVGAGTGVGVTGVGAVAFTGTGAGSLCGFMPLGQGVFLFNSMTLRAIITVIIRSSYVMRSTTGMKISVKSPRTKDV